MEQVKGAGANFGHLVHHDPRHHRVAGWSGEAAGVGVEAFALVDHRVRRDLDLGR